MTTKIIIKNDGDIASNKKVLISIEQQTANGWELIHSAYQTELRVKQSQEYFIHKTQRIVIEEQD